MLKRNGKAIDDAEVRQRAHRSSQIERRDIDWRNTHEQKTRHADDRLKHYEQCHKEKAPKITLPDLQLADTSAIHLLLEAGTLKGVVTKLPERSDIDYEVAEHLIVELYSK